MTVFRATFTSPGLVFRFRAVLAPIFAGCLMALTGCTVYVQDAALPSPALPEPTVSPRAGSPIEHIVVIMQENRTFDNLFNGFPGADTAQSGMSNGTRIPLRPLALGDRRDLKHTHRRWWLDWNRGAMDGFAQSQVSPPTLPYSYVPRKDVEPYWDLALRYTIGDRMFQSNTGPSFVAHQYMIAGQSGNVSGNPTSTIWGCDAPSGATAPLLGPDGTELPGVFPCFDYPTIADLLDKKGVTWRYYAPMSTDSFYELSAYQAIRHIRYGEDWKVKIITPQNRVLTDIAAGQLAQVTWIVPDFAHSDHPGSGDEGPDWVASIVNAIGKSPFWKSTAIFVSWDDWGGWYDHVDPPRVDAMGPGFRVPLLVISPWAKHGYVSHVFHSASGFNTFIEWDYRLPTLGTRDALLEGYADCFDWKQKPEPFNPVPTKVTAKTLIQEKSSGAPDDD